MTAKKKGAPMSPPAAPCACVPGQSRCREADNLWESANAVYRSQGYDAWLRALEAYNEHAAQVDEALNV